jgi:hypothetical protein
MYIDLNHGSKAVINTETVKAFYKNLNVKTTLFSYPN